MWAMLGHGSTHARIQGGGQGGNIAPPNSEARAKRALAPRPPPPPLQNPGSAYGTGNPEWTAVLPETTV